MRIAQAFSRVKTDERKNNQVRPNMRKWLKWKTRATVRASPDLATNKHPRKDKMDKRIVILRMSILIILTALSGCQAAASDDPRAYAQKLMQDSGQASAKITNVVSGNQKYKRADALWCIATDTSTQDGQVPYLLAVWRTGGKWDGTVLEQGYYEWDLYGCPR